MDRPEGNRLGATSRDEYGESDTLPVRASRPPELPPPTPHLLAAGPPPHPGPLLSRREALILLTGTLALPVSAGARSDDPFSGDARLRRTLTIRVSRMPLADLFQRLEPVLSVRLVAEGEDVADQKIDLFVKDLPAAEILTAFTNLLNAEGPRGYRWERSGKSPNHRYSLVRDLVSRQWEARRVSEVEGRLTGLLRDRLQSLRNEPFRAQPDRPRELPAMRKLLCTLTDAQVTQLGTERFLRLSQAFDPEPSPVWKELSEEAITAAIGRNPEKARGRIEGTTADNLARLLRVDIRLLGDPAQYRVHVGVNTPVGGGMSEVCRFVDPAVPPRQSVRAPSSDARPVPRDTEPAFALPPRTAWLMGDVLADLAARADVNLIADDYTVEWPELGRWKTPRPLSAWLAPIEEAYGFAPTWDGPFLRLRNRRWWSDRRREVPQRLVTHWAELVRGSSEDRLQALVEIAHATPLSHGFSPARDRLSPLRASPAMMELVPNPTDPERNEFVYVAAWLQPELRIYELLPPSQRQVIREEGLTLTWREMPPAIRALFTRSVCDYWEPGIPAENLRESGLFLRFHGDHLSVRYLIRGVPPARAERTRSELEIAPAQPVRAHRLVGQPAPELQVEDRYGKSVPVPLHGPLLLYLAPAWPRPVVTREEEFADLRALQALQEAVTPGQRILVLGTDATVGELRTWWKERGLTLPPLALIADSARNWGVLGQPVAAIVDAAGQVVWAKEGYTPGDEMDWRRELGGAMPV
jgi:hypothetical protein